MISNDIIDEYLSKLKLSDYPKEIINRRHVTFTRFIQTHGELNKINIINFIEANDFLRSQTYNLLKLDILSLLHFCKELDSTLFLKIDKLAIEID